jgi:hypothetical protein
MLDPVTGMSGLYPVPSRQYSRTGTGASYTSPRRASFMDPSSPAPVSANGRTVNGLSNSPPPAGARTGSGDAVLEGHAAYMQHLQQQTSGGIISPIIGSPLNPMHIRTQSSSAGVGGADGAAGSIQGSPAQLSFALPRTSTMGSRQSAQSGLGHGYGLGVGQGTGTGALSPVKESALSRAPTLSEKRE